MCKKLFNQLYKTFTAIFKPSYPTLEYTDLVFSSRTKVKNPTKLMIVAHPDDESIFGGEALIAGSDWTVVCVTNASDAVRREEFFQAMEFAGANYTILDHQDNLANGRFHPHLLQTLGELLDEFPYTTVVTHNCKGEYGHIQHRSIHRMVRSLVGNHTLLVFGKRRGSAGMSDEKHQLLGLYRSQQGEIRKYRHLAEREILKKPR